MIPNNFVLNPVTARHIQNLVSSPPQALIISGPGGIGKLSLSKLLAETFLELKPSGFESYPYGLFISPEVGKAVGIEAVRELQHFLTLKVPAKTAINRVAIIENGHLLTKEAQNALLKTLEEPNQGASIIITTNNLQALLPTVRSRAAHLPVSRPEQAALIRYFSEEGHSQPAVEKALAISGGLPGLSHALLNQADHPLLAAAERARQLLSQPLYEKLLTVDELSKQREAAKDVTAILQQMAHFRLQTVQGKAAAKWQTVLKASYQAEEALLKSAQPKLVLLNLMLAL